MSTSASDGNTLQSTIPNTPASVSKDVMSKDDEDVFAWLRPLNQLTRDAFDAALNAIIEHPDDYKHERRFFHADQRSIREASVFTDDGGDAEPPVVRWDGSFKFNLDILPRIPGEGWYLGTGEVDVLLAPPSKKWKGVRVAGRHARIFFHEESGRVMIEARHTITLGATSGPEVFTRPVARVLEHGCFLNVGDCLYVFEYTDHFKTASFGENLCRFMKKHYKNHQSLHGLLTPASTGKLMHLGGYTCSRGAFAQGTFGQVSAGWGRDGAPVAIKRFKNPNFSELRAHETIMTYLGHHQNILRLVNCITEFSTGVPSAYCVYSPLAIGSLSDLLKTHSADSNAKVTLLSDYARGLAYLHEKGVMHRDINPNNLGIVSFQPPKGVILDLDSALQSDKSDDHMKGTVPYLAPEILALKHWDGAGTEPPPYTKSVDIWALGLSMFVLEIGLPLVWKRFKPNRTAYSNPSSLREPRFATKSVHEMFHQHLRERRRACQEPNLARCLRQVENMTRWDVIQRVRIDQLLKDVELLVRDDQKGSIVMKRGQKRPLVESDVD